MPLAASRCAHTLNALAHTRRPQLSKCARSKCAASTDAAAAGRACRDVFSACAQPAAGACRAKCARAQPETEQACVDTCVFAVCGRDASVRACKADAAVRLLTDCALAHCRDDFKACMQRRCGL